MIDLLLATAFLVIVLVTHLGATDSAVKYHDADLVSVLFTIGVAVPYYFRQHAPPFGVGPSSEKCRSIPPPSIPGDLAPAPSIAALGRLTRMLPESGCSR
jgi:hypothetical protein